MAFVDPVWHQLRAVQVRGCGCECECECGRNRRIQLGWDIREGGCTHGQTTTAFITGSIPDIHDHIFARRIYHGRASSSDDPESAGEGDGAPAGTGKLSICRACAVQVVAYT